MKFGDNGAASGDYTLDGNQAVDVVGVEEADAFCFIHIVETCLHFHVIVIMFSCMFSLMIDGKIEIRYHFCRITYKLLV
jgi:hypothetical protein